MCDTQYTYIVQSKELSNGDFAIQFREFNGSLTDIVNTKQFSAWRSNSPIPEILTQLEIVYDDKVRIQRNMAVFDKFIANDFKSDYLTKHHRKAQACSACAHGEYQQ